MTQVDLAPADVSLLMALLEAHKAQLEVEARRVEALIMRLPFAQAEATPRPPQVPVDAQVEAEVLEAKTQVAAGRQPAPRR